MTGTTSRKKRVALIEILFFAVNSLTFYVPLRLPFDFALLVASNLFAIFLLLKTYRGELRRRRVLIGLALIILFNLYYSSCWVLYKPSIESVYFPEN